MIPRQRALLLTATVALVFSGCATTNAQKAGAAPNTDDDWVNPVQESDEGNGFRKVTLDINEDSKPDVFNYYRVGEGDEDKLLVRKEIDLNFDGTKDISQIWNEGQMTQEQIDADFDGRNDWTDFYDRGERIRAEWDTSYDGHPDLIRYYEGGKISRVERDTTGDHKIDYWEYYDAGGVMQRSGWDLNADGKVDRWGEN